MKIIVRHGYFDNYGEGKPPVIIAEKMTRFWASQIAVALNYALPDKSDDFFETVEDDFDA